MGSLREKCVIHIGMAKTGSSAIQKSLNKNLADERYFYANLGMFNHSVPVKTMFANSPKSVERLVREGFSEQDITDRKHFYVGCLIDNILSSNKNLILSGEGIIHLGRDGLERLRDLLSRFYKKVEVVAYVRSPKAMIESHFQQHIKNHNIDFNLEKFYPNYRKKFEKFDDVFGRSNVTLWKFEPSGFKDKCVVRDFCSKLGIEFSSDEVLRANEGLSLEAVSILYVYRKLRDREEARGASYRDANLVKYLSNIHGGKLKFSKGLIKPILSFHENDVHWMENRLGVPFSERMNNETVHSIASEKQLMDLSMQSVHKAENTMLLGQANDIKDYEGVAAFVEKLRASLTVA